MKRTTLLLLILGGFALSSWKEGLAGCEIFKGQNQATLDVKGEEFTPPQRKRGKARLNVKDYGAAANGIKDDTEAFQKAIDALPEDGGTVFVPSGTYLINGDLKDVKRKEIPGNCIRLRSNMHLELSPDATLKAKPTDAYATRIIYVYGVSDVEISGGKLIGERDQHLTTTGEYGHGIHIKGSNRVTIRNVHLSKFWGDGVCIGSILGAAGNTVKSNDVVIDHVISTGNRRQGLSIGPATNVQVWNSEFNETSGTAPQCGIDIEPERDHFTDNVLIQNCIMRNNHAYGILLFRRVSNVTIKNCEIYGNNSGIVCDAPANTTIALNKIHNNRNNGLVAKDSTNYISVIQNTFYENGANLPRQSALKISGISPETAKDVLIRPKVSNLHIDTNTYR